MLAVVLGTHVPSADMSSSAMTKSSSALDRMCSGFAVFGSDTLPSCSVYRMHSCGTDTPYFSAIARTSAFCRIAPCAIGEYASTRICVPRCAQRTVNGRADSVG